MGLETILENTNGLINSIISRYRKYYEYDDLYQVAAIGVIKAYKNFKPSHNVKFSTYAYRYILGEVLKYASINRGIKTNQEYRTLGKKIEEARTILTQKLMKEPSTIELSSFLSLPASLIEDITISSKKLDSLDRTITKDGKELTIMDTITSSTSMPSEEDIMLHTAISTLQEPDRSIISLTYFKDYTQDMVASSMGMSQVQVSRNLTRSKKKLKKILQPIK